MKMIDVIISCNGQLITHSCEGFLEYLLTYESLERNILNAVYNCQYSSHPVVSDHIQL